MPKTNEYIFYQGKRFQVEFFFDKAGGLPAKEYLESLREQKVLVKLATFVNMSLSPWATGFLISFILVVR